MKKQLPPSKKMKRRKYNCDGNDNHLKSLGLYIPVDGTQSKRGGGGGLEFEGEERLPVYTNLRDKSVRVAVRGEHCHKTFWWGREMESVRERERDGERNRWREGRKKKG